MGKMIWCTIKFLCRPGADTATQVIIAMSALLYNPDFILMSNYLQQVTAYYDRRILSRR